jgi:hypothetical protein
MTTASSPLQRGSLEWTGEHWISMLRPPGSVQDSAVVSHYSLRICPRGEGNVAVVRIGGEEGVHAVCTDNADMLDWAIPRCFERAAYWHAGLPVLESTFTRWGDATREAGWRIQTEDGHEIVTGWTVTDPPVVMNTPWRDDQEVFSILYFTDEATVELDGGAVAGNPYPRDIWKDTLGGDRSSCVFALSESFFNL